MQAIIIYILTYLSGLLIAYWMLKVEHEAEGEETTRLMVIITKLLSLLSWAMVLVILAGAWFGKIGKTGYWKKPINKSE